MHLQAALLAVGQKLTHIDSSIFYNYHGAWIISTVEEFREHHTKHWHRVNTSLNLSPFTGCIPSEWKSSDVTPIHKIT